MQRLWSDEGAVAAQDWPSARELFFPRCRSKKVFEHTLHWYKNALGGFLRYQSQERVIPATPFSLVEKPEVEKKLIQPLNMDQVRLLLTPVAGAIAVWRAALLGPRIAVLLEVALRTAFTAL